MGDPLIVTLLMDAASDEIFQTQRRAHFPPELNKVPAHLTLFHHLPGQREAWVLDVLGRACAQTPRIDGGATGFIRLGRGLAYRIVAPDLVAFRNRLVERFQDVLIAQDRGGFRPHVTIQNKATAARAIALEAHLTASFEPFPVIGEGLQIWRYKGGPWEPLGVMLFGGSQGGETA